jgi:hypothetical protein
MARRLLEPVTQVAPRPDRSEGERLRYLRSYLFMRTMIGTTGILLPVALLLGDLLLSGRGPAGRNSLSAYYWSGGRDVFVGALCAISVFLITYKVVEANLDNTLSVVAGLAALTVALFPTARPDPSVAALTPLQERLGETAVSAVHVAGAVVFIGSLAALSVCFAIREGCRPARPTARCGPRFWRTYHLACAGVIAVAVAGFGLSELLGGPDWAPAATEVVAVWAFGASWLAKGLELDVLLGTAPAVGRSARPRGTFVPTGPEGAGRELTRR